MDTFADSKAISEPGRAWPQHQASLTLLSEMVSNPAFTEVKWLDLACGEGQILTTLESGFEAGVRNKIAYTGFDRKDSYLLTTEKIASMAGLARYQTQVGSLSAIGSVFAVDRFDFITLINTVHEIDPRHLALVLVDATLRLADGGALYIYDMESVDPVELGAIAWLGGEIQSIIAAMLEAFGVGQYHPSVVRWSHKTRNGWSLIVKREHLAGVSNLEAMKLTAEAATRAKVYELLQQKIETCKKVLESLTTYGAETAEERKEVQALLYDFWALNRALEAQ
jgi:SAM-dependent methyltransferase